MTRAEFTSIFAAMLLALAAGPVLADDQQERAPLIESLGDHHHEVTTDAPEA